jgi:hypothetical protein
MIGEYLRDLPTQPVDRVVPADVRQRLMSLPLPVRGQTPQEILDFLGREIMPWPVAIGHSRSYAWVNSPPAPISILADSVANCDEQRSRRLRPFLHLPDGESRALDHGAGRISPWKGANACC